MALIIFLLLALVGSVYFWVKRRYSYWTSHGFIQVDGSFPFGSLKGVGSKVHMSGLLNQFYKKYKNVSSVIGIYFFTIPTVLVMDLDLIKDILVRDFNSFHDRGFYYNLQDDPLSGHLFSLEGKAWKAMRAKLSPTFTTGKIKMMFSTVLGISNELVDYMKQTVSWKESKDIELKDLLAQFTTDVIGNVAFGLDIQCLKNPDNMFRKMSRRVFETPPGRSLKVLFMICFQSFAKFLRLKITEDAVSEFFLNSLAATVKYRELNNIDRPDFLNLMIQIKNKGEINGQIEGQGKITFEEMAAQCFLFFIAGFESASTTLTFALYELSLNLSIQDKLRKEITDIMKEHNNVLSYEVVMEMKYLQMVIEETLRKYVPAESLIRKAGRDYKVPNTNLVIPKDTLIFIPIFPIHRDENIFEDPERFEPERFSEENKMNRHPMAYLPFGEGPRHCIGVRFGFMQMKIGLIQMLTNFHFKPCDKTTIPMEFVASAPLLAPVNDMWLKVERL